MWGAMMAAMMLPSSAPMVRVCASAALRRLPAAKALAWIGAFVLGYLLVWVAYGVAAALLHSLLRAGGALSEAMALQSARLGGGILLLAGLYQWTAFKHACLERCRSPFSFILLFWRDGAAGALAMGLRHGGYCVGCCWALMLLLFVGGVMNMVWIALLAALALAEKVVPQGATLARAGGLLLLGVGLYLVVLG